MELYTYKAFVTKVYDGDTITIDVDLGFGVKFTGMKVRLANIDTPELSGEEREAGLISRDVVREKILNKEVFINTEKDSTGKYGRYIATIYVPQPILEESEGQSNWLNLNKWLVDNKYAEKYGDKWYV